MNYNYGLEGDNRMLKIRLRMREDQLIKCFELFEKIRLSAEIRGHRSIERLARLSIKEVELMESEREST